MNCNTPTDIGFSFAGFRRRGGDTDRHTDGFGIAFFEQDGLRLFYDNRPSFDSPVADLINNHPIKALNVIAHIRLATQGSNRIANTHPFMRELWGEPWVFAHNGQLDTQFYRSFTQSQPSQSIYYSPVGDTDSELAFCFLLNQLRIEFDQKPSDSVLFDFLTEQCRYLSQFGLFNCLLSNGKWQLAYANTLLFYLTRRRPFGTATLSDDDLAIDFSEVTQATDQVTVLVTIPLTHDEVWSQLAVDECLIFREGQVVYRNTPAKVAHIQIEEGLRLARQVGSSI